MQSLYAPEQTHAQVGQPNGINIKQQQRLSETYSILGMKEGLSLWV